MSKTRERCKRCGRLQATREDIGTMEGGEDGGLCWADPSVRSGGYLCEQRDWPAELADAKRDLARILAAGAPPEPAKPKGAGLAPSMAERVSEMLFESDIRTDVIGQTHHRFADGSMLVLTDEGWDVYPPAAPEAAPEPAPADHGDQYRGDDGLCYCPECITTWVDTDGSLVHDLDCDHPKVRTSDTPGEAPGAPHGGPAGLPEGCDVDDAPQIGAGFYAGSVLHSVTHSDGSCKVRSGIYKADFYGGDVFSWSIDDSEWMPTPRPIAAYLLAFAATHEPPASPPPPGSRTPNAIEAGLMRTVAEDTARMDACGAYLDRKIDVTIADDMVFDGEHVREILREARDLLRGAKRPPPPGEPEPTCAVCGKGIGERPATQGYEDGRWRHDSCASESSEVTNG